MTHPAFFDAVPPLVLHDPLAELLGAAEGGRLVYHYADAVRLAGHSCPTVAGAWLLTARALALLYPGSVPVRGNLRVQMREAASVANAGVVGAVIGLITGAAGEAGFQGLGGRMARRGLLEFGIAMTGDARFVRCDNGAAVELVYRPQSVPPEAALQALMPAVVGGMAGRAEAGEFARMWQDRVRRLLLETPADAVVEATGTA